MKAVKKYLAVIMSIFMIASVYPAAVYASPEEGNVAEEILDAEEAAPVPELAEVPEAESIESDEINDEVQEEIVGAEYQVGDGVTAKYDLNTHDVVFESYGGTLWKDWLSKSGLKANSISSIRAAGTLYLPSDSSHLFEKCSSLKNLDLSNFNTSNVTNMGCMFEKCTSLKNLNLSKFNTSNVTSMNYMFYGCSSLTELDLSSFNTSNVQYMDYLFLDCSSLTKLNLSSFDTSNVISMSAVFGGCDSLTKLDLSSFSLSPNLISMYGMFRYCRNLKYLDLSSFDTSKMRDTYDMYIMFEGATNLEVLRTPKKHRRTDVDLPITMYDKEGNAYTTLPVVENSIVLGKTQAIAYEYSVNDISKCAITINPTSYMYDGTSKEPYVTVMDGTRTLALGTDYTVTYTKNKNAGTAVVTITATETGDYEGSATVNFTIEKADAGLGFGVKGIIKKLTDDAFTLSLTKATTAAVTFISDNTSVATVDSATGKVTIKGAGTTAIIASANETTNYTAGSAAYILTVEMPVNSFSDVQDPNHAYYKAIYWAADAGITKGYPDGTFGINRDCTRGEMMMFLWRYAGKKEPTPVSKSPFKDVPKTHTFYKAILWGSQKGITKGYSDGTFGINRNVSRGECMMFLWRLKGKPAPKAVAKAPFPDVPKSHVFYNAVLWGFQKKITTGFTSGPLKGKFGVNENCSRGQIVTFLYRARTL